MLIFYEAVAAVAKICSRLKPNQNNHVIWYTLYDKIAEVDKKHRIKGWSYLVLQKIS